VSVVCVVCACRVRVPCVSCARAVCGGVLVSVGGVLVRSETRDDCESSRDLCWLMVVMVVMVVWSCDVVVVM
jgi:hypothetical protein